MNIFIIHDAKRKSPYFEALSNALKPYNMTVVIASELPPKKRMIERSIIHFHRLGRFIGKYKDKRAVIRELNDYKKNGYELAWTVHNFFPLEMTNEITMLDFYHFLIDFAKCMDYIFTHTEVMKKNAEKLFGVNNVSCIGYGVDYALQDEKNTKVTSATKSRKFTYLQIGNMRDYKGIEELIDSFRILSKQGYDIRLILAGPQYKNYMNNNVNVIDQNIMYIDRYIYEAEYKHLINISDVMVFPYRVNMNKFKYGFYSAAIPEAAYHKKFLIVPNNESIINILKDVTLCETFDISVNNDLINAMERVLHLTKKEIKKKESALYSLICENTWDRVAQSMVNVFTQELTIR